MNHKKALNKNLEHIFYRYKTGKDSKVATHYKPTYPTRILPIPLEEV